MQLLAMHTNDTLAPIKAIKSLPVLRLVVSDFIFGFVANGGLGLGNVQVAVWGEKRAFPTLGFLTRSK